LGEVAYGNNLTLRTSIVGPELKEDGIGLFHWFMQQHGEIKGYTQAFWTGVTTIELAQAIVAAIEQDITGLHHLVCGEKISKYDLIGLFKSVFGTDVQIKPFGDYHVDKSLQKDESDFDYSVPSYQVMIERMKDWMDEHEALYKR
jgi:dTDP-4-dehydrorhamnose reductase